MLHARTKFQAYVPSDLEKEEFFTRFSFFIFFYVFLCFKPRTPLELGHFASGSSGFRGDV